MKVEVQFIGESVDTEVYEGECVSWAPGEGYLDIYAGESLFNWEPVGGQPPKVASYPEGRVVRVRVIE